MLVLRDLVFDYPGKRALRGVSLEIERGTISALVGPNGAGKTTLLRCVAGLQAPLRGTVVVDGVDAIEDRRACHRLLGYLSDFFGVYETLSVERCLSYMALAQGVPEVDVEKVVARAIERVGLTAYRTARAGTLSRGLRQRLALGLAIVHEPKLLLLDEPAAGLDPEARHALSQLLLQFQSEGVTIVVSSHILAELEDYCTDMVILSEGKIVEQQRVHSRRSRRYRVEVAGDASQALSILGSLDGVRHARSELDYIVFEHDGDKASVAAVLTALVQQGVLVASFAEQAQQMQEVYLASLSQARGES